MPLEPWATVRSSERTSLIKKRAAFWAVLLALVGVTRLLPKESRLASDLVLLAIAAAGVFWVLIENFLGGRRSKDESGDKRATRENLFRAVVNRILERWRRNR